jgi:transposase
MSNFITVNQHCKTFLGIDLHTTAATYAAIDNITGKITKTTIPNHCTGKISAFAENLAKPLCIGIESMGCYYWLWDLLEPFAQQIHLIDALDLSKLRPRMADTDKISASKIAYIMKNEHIPAAYAPSKEIRRLRMLARQWHRITQEAAKIKTVTRWEMLNANCRGPKNITAAYLQRYILAQSDKFDKTQAFTLWTNQNRISLIEQQKDFIIREARSIISENIHLRQRLEIITSVKGIGEALGFIIMAEFGDFQRFKNADAVACWTGLTERSHISNRQTYQGKISKAGSATLRWALSEAAFELTKFDSNFKESYQRLVKKTGVKGKARTAMARRLARILWKMVITDTPFKAGYNPDKSLDRANNVRLKRLKNKSSNKKETAQA